MTTINDHYNVAVQSRFYEFLQEDREGVEPEALIASVERQKELKKENKSKAKKDKIRERAEEEARERERAEAREKAEKAEKELQEEVKAEELIKEDTDCEVKTERSHKNRGGSRRGGRDGTIRSEPDETNHKPEYESKYDGRMERDNRGRGGSKRGTRGEGHVRLEGEVFNEESNDNRSYGNNKSRPYRKEMAEEDSFNKVGYFEEHSYPSHRGGTDRRRPYGRGGRSSRGNDRNTGDEYGTRVDGEDEKGAFDGTTIQSNRGRHPRFDRDNIEADDNAENTFSRGSRGRYQRPNKDTSDNVDMSNDRPSRGDRGRYQRFNRDSGDIIEGSNETSERTSSRGGRGRFPRSNKGPTENIETYEEGTDNAPQRNTRGRYQRYNRDMGDDTVNNQENMDAPSFNGRGRYVRHNKDVSDNVDDVHETRPERNDGRPYVRRNREMGDNIDNSYDNSFDNAPHRGSRGRFPRPNRGGLNRFSEPNNEEGATFEHSRMGYFNENVDIREFRGRGRSRGSRGSRRGRGDFHRTEQENEENSHIRSEGRVSSPPPPIDNWEAVPDNVLRMSPPQVWPDDNETEPVEEKNADWGEIEDDPAEIKIDCKVTMTLEEWKALNNKDRLLNQTLDGKEIRKANDGQDVFSGMSEYRKGKCLEEVGAEEHDIVHESTAHQKIKKEIPLAVRFSRNSGEPIVIDNDRSTYEQGYVDNIRSYQRSYGGRGRENQGTSGGSSGRGSGPRGSGRGRGGSDFRRSDRDGQDFNATRKDGSNYNMDKRDDLEGSDMNSSRRGGSDYNSGRRGGSEFISGRRGSSDNSDFNTRGGRGGRDNRSDIREGSDENYSRRGGTEFSSSRRGVSNGSNNDFGSRGGSNFNSRSRGSEFTSRTRGSDFNMYGRGRDFNRGRRNPDYQGNIKEEEHVAININLGNEEEFPHLS